MLTAALKPAILPNSPPMVRLFALTPEIYAQVLKWAEDPEMSEYFRRSAPIMDWATDVQGAMGWCYVVYEGTTPVGLIQLIHNDTRAKSIEVAVLIDKALCTDRSLVSREAYKQISNYIFHYLDYNKIYMRMLASRDKLIKRLKSGAWVVEANLRHSCKFQDKLVDEVIMGLLKEDYNEWLKGQGE